ncbi:MAG: hypothetical protein AB7E60_10930 [Sphingobium sp.]
MVSNRALGRRSLAERRVIAWLRGDPGARRLPAAQRAVFAELARAARANGLVILPPGSPFIGMEEMLLLAWVASAQRVVAITPPPSDPALACAIVACADTLTAMNARMSTLALYGALLHLGGDVAPRGKTRTDLMIAARRAVGNGNGRKERTG